MMSRCIHALIYDGHLQWSFGSSRLIIFGILRYCKKPETATIYMKCVGGSTAFDMQEGVGPGGIMH
jgi:hypothetical protein